MIGDWSVIEKYIQTFILEFIDQLLYILTRLIIAAYDIVKKKSPYVFMTFVDSLTEFVGFMFKRVFLNFLQT